VHTILAAIKTFAVEIPPVPVLKEALVCIVDSPARWAKAAERLPFTARIAAALCSGSICHFCGTVQEEIPAERLDWFHPDYPLCECLMPLRMRAHEYIKDWSTPVELAKLLASVDTGAVAGNTPVYQYLCACGAPPCVVTAGYIAHSAREHGRQIRKTRCSKCNAKHAAAVNKINQHPPRASNPAAKFFKHAPQRHPMLTPPQPHPTQPSQMDATGPLPFVTIKRLPQE